RPHSKPQTLNMYGRGDKKKTLRLVAKYAYACNLYAFESAEPVRAKLRVLRQHCENLGRSFDEIERTAIGAFDLEPNGTSPRQAIEHCRGLSDAGIQHLIVSLPRVHEITPIEVMAKEVLPAVADFQPG